MPELAKLACRSSAFSCPHCLTRESDASVPEFEMIDAYASVEARKPGNWGGGVPDPAEVARLAASFVHEWKGALDHMLRHWEPPPTID
ncbi:hypothetical protein HYFRA_00000599 [Hymenoscyphus fraxineus]|uniref:Uncharacterized protein n=1 Tax=Hymenoscyphus fraxineus TaxID=746836 RepID=A0A9N9L5S1_9HELO|nr:hypothetical protein HYFRA_00000599 [Hymenoscyphus fraxineus]